MEDTIAGQTVWPGDIIFDRGMVIGVWCGPKAKYVCHSDSRILRKPGEMFMVSVQEYPSPLEDLALGRGLRAFM